MPPILKAMFPYVLAVVGAIVIFAAGAYASMSFTARMFLAPQLGRDELNRLVDAYSVLYALDAGKPDEARSLLVMREGINILSLETLAPYLSPELAKSTCGVMRKVAKHRAENPSLYSGDADFGGSAEVRKDITAALQRPTACRDAR